MSDEQLRGRVALLRGLGWIAAAGAVLLIVPSALPDSTWAGAAFVAGVLACLPAMFYLLLLTLWHWKARYRGVHSDLWGGVLLLETSGLFKLIYLFRHVLPDARGIGRYRRTVLDQAA